jgi:hypothetical protein
MGFKEDLMEMDWLKDGLCPCGSGGPFESCCLPEIESEEAPCPCDETDGTFKECCLPLLEERQLIHNLSEEVAAKLGVPYDRRYIRIMADHDIAFSLQFRGGMIQIWRHLSSPISRGTLNIHTDLDFADPSTDVDKIVEAIRQMLKEPPLDE